MEHLNDSIKGVVTQLNSVILGKDKQVKLALACILSKGHLLIEDLPGMGKTTLSHALAISLGLSYQRAQFTSDMLPADLIGVSIFNQKEHTFQFHSGPLFNQLLLADEINRASPKTQSALLEAMEEKQISVDGTTHKLPTPFFVIATQNPIHQSGTFELPESQLDRFLMTIKLGYPDPTSELAMLKEQINPIDCIETILTTQELLSIQKSVESITTADSIYQYILDLVNFTRSNKHYTNPLSPRASRHILNTAKAWAYIHNRDYVMPDDVQAILPFVCEHRLRGNTDSNGEDAPYTSQLLSSVSVPV